MNAVARKSSSTARQSAGTPDDVEKGVSPPAGSNWQHERDAGHIWQAISGLKEKSGELGGLVVNSQRLIENLRDDLKGIDNDIEDLKLEQRSTAKTVKVVGLVATPLIALVAFVAPYFWSNSMRPELERSIAAQVKVELEREQAARERTRQLESENAELRAKLRSRDEK